MAQTSLLRPEGLVQSPAFTHVAVVPPGATTVYIGGQNAVDGDGTLVGGDDAAAQTKQVMKNLHVALAAAGASVEDPGDDDGSVRRWRRSRRGISGRGRRVGGSGAARRWRAGGGAGGAWCAGRGERSRGADLVSRWR